MPVSATQVNGAPERSWLLYLGLGLSTGSLLLLQVFLTRISTVLFNASFAFLAISLTFLGLGSAGVLLYLLGDRIGAGGTARLLPRAGLAYAVLMVMGGIVLVAADSAIMDGFVEGRPPLEWQVGRVLVASLCMLPAAVAVGVLISLTLKTYVARVNRLYCADLVGGGVGCLLAIPLMNHVGGDHGIFVIGAMAALGAAAIGFSVRAGRIAVLSLVAALLLCVGPWANQDHDIIGIRSQVTTTMDTSWVDNETELHRGWNSLSRIGIHPPLSGDALYVRIDSSCQTAIPTVNPQTIERLAKRRSFDVLPFVLERHGSYLEIGAGGGQGMLAAHAKGARRIVGVEINPIITGATLRGGFDGYGIASLAEDPAIELVTDEGRSYVARSEERFETITITFIQTGAADASGGFALTEANLFTVEAFVEYLGHLEGNGLFFIYRHGGTEMLRLISVVRAAMQQLGVDDVRRHTYVARNPENRAVLMVSRSPFTSGEISRLDRTCDEWGLHILYTPSGRLDQREPHPFLEKLRSMRAAGELDLGRVAGLYQEALRASRYAPLEHTYLTSPDPEAFADEYPIDISPTTDDRPYFFFSSLKRFSDWPHYVEREGVKILGSIVMLLFWMLLAFALLVALLIFLPLLLKRGRKKASRGRAPMLLYFAGLGVTYVAVEISFIQRFVLFLGHPIHATSVVLLGFLVFSGFGSLCSDRIFRIPRWGFAATILSIAAILLVYNELLPQVFHSSAIGLPLAARIVVALVLILPLAFPMGMLFPQGLRIAEGTDPDLVPWAWGANSAASVLGTIVALILAIHFGFAFVTWATVGTYLALCLPSVVYTRRAMAR